MKEGVSMNEKELYMKRAIDIAKTAMGHTSPNPMVGCVIVKNGRIISEACHERYGESHAERNALLSCKEDTTGAELYVTLEPCCHYGKTPPCTDIIIEKKINKVYIGSLDSNPLVAGKGIEILREHGIDVECGILEDECLKMNEIFFHFIKKNTPFIAVKYAMTADGKIAAFTGDSKWVTSEKSREHVQLLRKKYAAILVGINTVLADNPMLNCRIEKGVDPVRIILDSKLRIPIASNIVQTAKSIPTIVAYSARYITDDQQEKIKLLHEYGIETVASGTDELVDLKMLLKELGKRKIDSILVEGGASVNAAFFEQKLVQKVYVYIAPKIIMGRNAKSPVGGRGIDKMTDAIQFSHIEVQQIDNDLLIKGTL